LRPVFSQFLLFSAVGAVGTAAHFAVLVVLVRSAATGPVYASMAGFATGALINYSLNYSLTFKSKNPHRLALPKFLGIALAGLFLNTLIMAMMTRWLHYLPSQALATLIVLAWNFFSNRHWTFGENPESVSLR